MAKFSLTSCVFKLKNTIDDSDIVNLDLITNPNDMSQVLDFYTVLGDYFRERTTNYSLLRGDKKFLQVSSYTEENAQIPRTENTARMYSGTIDSGDFDFVAKLKDVTTGAHRYTRRKNDAELLPYHFVIWAPKNLGMGILILQRFKQLGIKGDLNRDINQYLSSAYPDWNLKIEINDIIPSIVLQKYLSEGRIVKMRYFKNGLPSDFADRYDDPEEKINEGYIEACVCAKRQKDVLNCLRDDLRGFLSREVEAGELFTLMDVEYDNLKVEVELGNSMKTFNMSRIDSARPYVDITDDVTVGPDGHPVYNSINIKAKELLTAIKTQLSLRDI